MATVPTTQRDQPLFTIADYLTLERAAEERHEYLDGVVYAMAGESPNHGRICTNLVGSLSVHLRGTQCEAFSKDLKVRCGPTPRPGGSQEGLYAYPDVVVVCGPLQFHDQAQEVLLNPTLLIEVLSPSTEAFDRGQKFLRYRTWLPMLTDYVLVAQDRPLVEHYQRQAATWTLHTREGLEDHLVIPCLDWTMALADMYDRVVFAPALHD